MQSPGSNKDDLYNWIEEFKAAKVLEGISPRTADIYRTQMSLFLKFCRLKQVELVSQITSGIIRGFLLWLSEGGHKPTGQHLAYRVLKTFLRWYDLEAEPAGWRNPITKVKPPKLPEEPLRPVEIADVLKMVNTCETTLMGRRERAMLLFLLDTGARAREMLAVHLTDMNLESGAVLIRKGKGGKPRTVFIGEQTRAAMRAYLGLRRDEQPDLWVTSDGEPGPCYMGLIKMLKARSKAAGVDTPRPHDFRRAFAITMLRNGVDLVTLARLMGHTTLKVLQRYLYQIPDDLQAAHIKAGPVDRAMNGNGHDQPAAEILPDRSENLSSQARGQAPI